jgi:hypothetical protein
MRALVLLLPLLFAGCPPSGEKSAPAKPARCTKVGDQCEVSPGKLGACVRRDDCTQGDCFVCQSQH